MKNINAKLGQGYLILDLIDREYYSGIKLDQGFLLLSTKSYYFTDARYFHAVEKDIIAKGIIPVLYKDILDIKTVLDKESITTLYLDFEKVTVAEYNKYLSFNIPIKDCSAVIKEQKSVKSKKELENIKRACEIIQRAVANTAEKLRLNVTEKELSDFIYERVIELGGEDIGFETIVAFGANSAIPHHKTGSSKLEYNTPVLIDAGAKYNGYISDITRTFFFGEPSKEFIENYNLVKMANERAIEKITDGTPCRIADGYARQTFKDSGLEEYFTHSLGHGVGNLVHESPTLSPKSEQVLKNGNVFTIEPGLYFNDNYGIRIEDTVYLENGKVIRLFTDSKELKIIKK